MQTASTTSVTRPITPALADAQVLGGYGYAPDSVEVEKGLETLTTSPGTIDISSYNLCWSVMIWLPLHTLPSTAVQTLFILSVTLTSPLPVLNILFGSPIPIPTALFDIREPAKPNEAFLPGSLPPHKWSHEYRRSTSPSVTVVDGVVMSGSAIAMLSTGKESLGERPLRYRLSLNYQTCHLRAATNQECLLYLSRMMILNLFRFTAHRILHSLVVDLGRIRRQVPTTPSVTRMC